MARIGFVGLGHMGLPMAINLLKAGHQVTGFDLQAKAIESLINAGGIPANILADAATDQDVVITMLQTGEQVRQVCLGENGLFAHISPSKLYIDCSSIDVQSSRELHQHASQRQLAVVDAPVSGGVAGASAGTLTFMVGGEAQPFAQAKPFLSAMGKTVIHTGLAGSGQAAKICNNMILGISMIAISEAFVLAEQLGLSAQSLFEVVSNSSGQCWAMTRYVPVPGILPNVPANNHYQPGFYCGNDVEGFTSQSNSATAVGVETPMGALAAAIYQQFSDAGQGQLDFSAIIKAIANESR